MADRNYEEDFDYYDSFDLAETFGEEDDDEEPQYFDDPDEAAALLRAKIECHIENEDLASIEELVESSLVGPGFERFVLSLVMMEAARENRLRLLTVLHSLGVPLTIRGEEGESLLMEAAGAGQVEVVDWLLAKNVPIEREAAQECSALIWASAGGQVEIIARLFDAAHFDQEEIDDSLAAAAYAGERDAYEFLAYYASRSKRQLAAEELEFGVKRKARIRTPSSDPCSLHLLDAVNYGDVPRLRACLRDGADPNAVDSNGDPVLESLIVEGAHDEMVSALLDAGADPNSPSTEDGTTLLMHAIESENNNMVRLLLKAGANTNLRNDQKETALDWAVELGNSEAVALLARAGADLDCRDVGNLMRQANQNADRDARDILELGRRLATAINKPEMLDEIEDIERRLDKAISTGIIMSPTSVRLVPVGEATWSHPDEVALYRTTVNQAGFETIGCYRIDGLDDVQLCSFCLPGKSLYATVYDHPTEGVWIDLVTRYRDAHAITYTDDTHGAELEQPPWCKTVYLPGIELRELIDRCLQERAPTHLMEQDAAHFQADFEDAYQREVTWRLSHH